MCVYIYIYKCVYVYVYIYIYIYIHIEAGRGMLHWPGDVEHAAIIGNNAKYTNSNTNTSTDTNTNTNTDTNTTTNTNSDTSGAGRRVVPGPKRPAARRVRGASGGSPESRV